MTDTDQAALPLASEFPAATREQWRKLVDRVLKGAPFETLVARTSDGLAIEPLYAGDTQATRIVGRTPGATWQVIQRIEHPDPAAGNAEALHELENGATGLALVGAGAIGAYGYGLTPSADSIERTLAGIPLDTGIAIEFDFGAEALEASLALAALVERRGIAPGMANVRLGFDPLGTLAFTGASALEWRDLARGAARPAADLARRGFKEPFAAADGRVVHNAGGSEAQELAFVLAVAIAYLRAFEAEGIALDQARRMIFFRLAADTDQFLTMAKFRALRRLWARVEEACGLMPQAVFASAETAWRMMTRRDPWVNMLRTTIAAVSAGLGGADAVTVLPFTAALGLPDRFARRIARNTQLILLEESNLAKVADPAAGSGGIEDLTRKLCQASWTFFQEIEAAGGAAAALERGLIQRRVAATRAGRERAVAHRKDALTGTSEFPDLAEVPVFALDVAPRPPPPRDPAIACEPLPLFRLAEPYERLRDASDRMLETTGARPTVFLANLGRPADFSARATFAKSSFEAGGIQALTNDGFVASPLSTGVKTDLPALIAAFKASGAKLACLCSTDAVYALEAEKAAEALSAAGARHIYLAGKPAEQEPALRAAGVGTFIYAGADALATLQAAHAMLGASTMTRP